MTTTTERRIFTDVTNPHYGRRSNDKVRFVLDETRVPMWFMPVVFITLNVVHYCWVNGIV